VGILHGDLQQHMIFFMNNLKKGKLSDVKLEMQRNFLDKADTEIHFSEGI
jgi:hypothetical protein